MANYIVTGASSGIGRAVAAALADRGVTVVAAARRREQLDELAEQHGESIRPLAADLATEAGLAALAAAVSDFDEIAGVVHAAGSLVPVEPYTALTSDSLTHHFRIHVATPIEINNRLGAQLRGGRIIYIDSYSASSPRHGWSGYSIVKAAAQMAARAAEQELDGVDIIRIFPGGVRTPLVEAVLDTEGSPVGDAFRGYDAAGDIAEPAAIGAYIAHVALDTTESDLASHDIWDYADPTTHPPS